MTKIMIGYGTTEGQTARIADHIAEVIRGQGFEVQVLDLKGSQDVGLDGYDAVIVGGSIHMGKHEDHVADFVRKNRATLQRVPSAFFSVSLAAHGDMANAEAYVANFSEQTGWHPAQVGFFGGALLYRQYGFLKRLMMRRIVRDKPGGLSTDTSRDHVYTDWRRLRASPRRSWNEWFPKTRRDLDAPNSQPGDSPLCTSELDSMISPRPPK
jgi:menaquinone-dependent protoporphyrinogen oxidase